MVVGHMSLHRTLGRLPCFLSGLSLFSFQLVLRCLFIFLNKFIISFLFSVYSPSLFLPKPCRAPHSENLLAFKIHLHWIIYSFDKVLFCLMFIFFNNKKPRRTFPKDQKKILVFKDARQPWPKCTKQALGALSFVIWVFSPLLNILSSECVVGRGKVNKSFQHGLYPEHNYVPLFNSQSLCFSHF